MTRPRLGITMGDPAGIGPEILAKMLAHEPITELCIPVIVGDARVLAQATEIAGVELDVQPAGQLDRLEAGQIYIDDLHNIAPGDYRLGEVSARAGRAAGQFIERAIALALDGRIDAVVTNPIHKEAFTLGGYGERFAGHTEMFSELTGAQSTCMMLACGDLRVCHVTTHVSLLDALTRHIKRDRILAVIELAHSACLQLGIAAPRVGVAGVNPHASEDGLFGDEERREVIPAIAAARAQGIEVEGPVPADTLFSKAKGGMYDVVVAMYHDQGHIPVKLVGFVYDHADGSWQMRGINITLGLPIVRTSVDHGTAFDKAGRGVANHRSLFDAVRYALDLVVGSERSGEP